MMVMDERGGKLNYATVEVLRGLERKYWTACVVFKGKHFKAILPSETDLYNAAKRIEAVAHGIVNYTRILTPLSEGIKFYTIKAI
jgi:hypothetical protein